MEERASFKSRVRKDVNQKRRRDGANRPPVHPSSSSTLPNNNNNNKGSIMMKIGGGGNASSISGIIRFRTCFNNTILDAMKHREGWKEAEKGGDGGGWDLYWTDRDMMYEVFDTTHLDPRQRVNHYRNCRELCRKDLLLKNLKRRKWRLMKAGQLDEASGYDFWPVSYVLPGDYALFVEESKSKPNATWIMKPIARSQGKGIFIFHKLSQIAKWKSDSRRRSTISPISTSSYSSSSGNSILCTSSSSTNANGSSSALNPSATTATHPSTPSSSSGNGHAKNESTTAADGSSSSSSTTAELYTAPSITTTITTSASTNEDPGGVAETYIVQQYISNPYLVGGRKFDVRLYVLVTSFAPLTVWVYRAGFCRFTTCRYSNAASEMSNTYMHLTNVAIQKKSQSYDENMGGKWELRDLKLHLMSSYGVEAVDRLFHEIKMVILRSLLAVQPVMIQDKHCFELYGYDVMIDSRLKPWLLEVNASPSLSANTPADYQMKLQMLSACLDVVDMESKLKGDEIRIDGFDLIYLNGCPVGLGPGHIYRSTLGAAIPKEPLIERINMVLPPPSTTTSTTKTSSPSPSIFSSSSSSAIAAAGGGGTSRSEKGENRPHRGGLRKGERR